MKIYIYIVIIFLFANEYSSAMHRKDSNCKIRIQQNLQKVAKGDLQTVKEMIKRFGVNAKGGCDMTALHWAVESNQSNIVKYLLDQGADPNAVRSNNFDTPLHIALRKKYNDLAVILTNAGADVNADSEENGLPLQIVARSGDLSMAKFLICKGAKVNKICYRVCGVEETPLQAAIKNNQVEMVKYFLDENADVSPDNNNDLPLFTAILHNNMKMVQLLIQEGGASVYRYCIEKASPKIKKYLINQYIN